MRGRPRWGSVISVLGVVYLHVWSTAKDALELSTPVQIGQQTRKEVLGELLTELIEA